MKDIDKGVPTSIEVKCKTCKYKIQIRSTDLKKTSRSRNQRKKEKEPYHRYQCPRCGRTDKISYYVISQELLKELFNRKS